MKKREGRQDARREAGQALRLLARYSAYLSEWICASVLTEEYYPELSEKMERLAIREAERFRTLGRVMLKRGLNPPLRSVMSRGGSGVPVLSSIGELSLFLEKMREDYRHSEQAQEQILSTFGCEESESAPLREASARQIEELTKMIS